MKDRPVVRVLFIAPLPPPITGHSLAAQVLLDDLSRSQPVDVVNLSVGSGNDGTISATRVLEVCRLLAAVWRKKRRADVIYLTIAESLAGNCKDLVIYLLCGAQLSRFVIHLHGGSIKRLLFDRYPVVRWLNALAVRRMAGAIVSGPSHEEIFATMIDRSRIHVVPNFAKDELFVTEAAIDEKFARAQSVRVLYLSGMAEAKGYVDLVDAYLGLSPATRAHIHLDFAGRFDSVEERATFLRRVNGVHGIRYHGVVGDAAKQKLFAESHVFCLPTRMAEGQPISILEAYASGCVVVTTGQAGIRDIFADGRNGFEIEPASPRSITDVLERLHAMGPALQPIARRNRAEAVARYRTSRFNQDVRAILGAAYASNVAPIHWPSGASVVTQDDGPPRSPRNASPPA